LFELQNSLQTFSYHTLLINFHFLQESKFSQFIQVLHYPFYLWINHLFDLLNEKFHLHHYYLIDVRLLWILFAFPSSFHILGNCLITGKGYTYIFDLLYHKPQEFLFYFAINKTLPCCKVTVLVYC
jgi:hypothetical protein